MTRVRFHGEALVEFAEAAARYDAERPGLGVEFTDEVERAVATIAEAPARWPRWNASRLEQKVRVQRFPYLIIYEHVAGEVIIKAVAHMKRQPGYWQGRARRVKGRTRRSR